MSDYAALRAENAKVLRKLGKEVDLTRSYDVEFSVPFETRRQAQEAADYLNSRAASRAIRARVIPSEGEFDCALTVRMVPRLDDITEIEAALSEASDRFGGYETIWAFSE